MSNKQPYIGTGGYLPEGTIKFYTGIGQATGKIIVIFTDITSRSTNGDKIEEIATRLLPRLRTAPEKIVFIEHRSRRQDFEETYDLLHLEWHDRFRAFVKPAWSPFTKTAAEQITGTELIR